MKQDLDISNIGSKPTTPKRDRIRIERKKYDELVAERDRLKAENHAFRENENHWEQKYNAMKSANYKLSAENDTLKADNEKWEKAFCNQGQELDDAEEERDRLQAENSDLSAELMNSRMHDYKHLEDAVEKLHLLTEERDRLQAEVNEAKERNDFLASWWSKHNKKVVQDFDTLARDLRDQRDTARFIAAMFGLAAVGFAVAVWIGKLVPVV